MSDLPTPKYRIGDIVYYPTIDRETETLACPDCHNTRTWKAISLAGEEHEIACPRCTRCTDQYARLVRDKLPSLTVTRYHPRAKILTIASITAKTNPHNEHEAIEYMCRETSDGRSGSIYYERRLFDTDIEALAVATDEAACKNAEVDAAPEVTRSRAFSGLTYTDAAIKALKDGIFSSWQAFRSLGYAIGDMLPEDEKNDTEDQRALREAVERYGRYGGTYIPIERHPIDALIEGADNGTFNEALSNLKRLAGFPDRPEMPPCTCRHVGRYSRDRDCPRHGGSDEI